MKDTYIYPAVFDNSEDGISITFPDLPGCLPCADNVGRSRKKCKGSYDASSFRNGGGQRGYSRTYAGKQHRS